MRTVHRLALASGLCALGLLPLAASAQATLSEAYRVVETWPAQPQPRPAGELTDPAGVDVADDGTVFVVDHGTSNLHVLASDGRGLRLMGEPGSGPGQLNGPRDVDWDAGRLYVTDTGNDRVQVLDAATGISVAQWPGLGQPWGIAVAPSRVYVSSAAAPVVYVTDRGGARLAVWGPGQAVDLPFVTPRGLSISPDGHVYVADPGAGGVHVLTADGALVKTLSRGESSPLLQEPWDVAADDNAVYTIVRRQVFAWTNPTGPMSFVRPGQYHYGAQGIALGPGAGVVVTEQNGRTLFAGISYYADRGSINALPEPVVGTVPTPVGSLDGPRRLAAAVDDGAWLLDAWPRVQRWGPGGQPRGHFRAEGLTDVARAPGDDLYLVAAGDVRRVGPDGTERWRWPADRPGMALVAAASDGGDLFGLDAGLERIVRLTPDGIMSEVLVAGSLTDLAVAGGSIAVVDRSASAIRVLAPTGAEVRRWSAPWQAQRVAAGQDGSAWFVLSSDGHVWKYAADGTPLAVFDGAPGGLPLDLATDRPGRVLVADGDGGRVVVHALDPGGTPGVPPRPGDRCDLWPDKTAAPDAVEVGQPVTVTLELAGGCPSDSIELDLVLALDQSGSMEGPKLAGAQSAAIGFTAELDFGRARVAVVAFNQDAELVQPLTGDRAAVVRAVGAMQAAGLTDLAAPVSLALNELTGPRGRPAAIKVIVLMTDGRPEGSTADSARQAAETARQAGVQLYAIGLGGDVDGSLLTEMAGVEDRYFETPTDAGLARIYSLIARRLVTNILVRAITITDLLPINMRYVPDSAVPPATWDGVALTWLLRDVPAEGFRLRYQVEPLQSGRWPTNVHAEGSYTDGVGHQGRVTFPVPYITASGDHQVYLPILYKSRCPQQRSDIVVAIDASSSMLQPSSGSPGSKLDGAKLAAQSFVGYLGLPQDQAAVVAFNLTASLRQELTGDHGALVRAIDGITPAVGTRIDLGLAEARRELTSPRRRPGNLPVVILLTDGQPMGGSIDSTRAEARALREAGVAVFTIGLGADADGVLLSELAGDPARYYYAPSQSDLKAIYESIVWSLPCE